MLNKIVDLSDFLRPHWHCQTAPAQAQTYRASDRRLVTRYIYWQPVVCCQLTYSPNL